MGLICSTTPFNTVPGFKSVAGFISALAAPLVNELSIFAPMSVLFVGASIVVSLVLNQGFVFLYFSRALHNRQNAGVIWYYSGAFSSGDASCHNLALIKGFYRCGL